MSDCNFCGECRKCRLEERLAARGLSKVPVQLSPLSAQILNEPAYTRPAKKTDKAPRVPREHKTYVSSAARENKIEGQKSKRERRRAECKEVDGRMVHPLADHGTMGGYTDYMCRCIPCTDANNLACKLRRHEKLGYTPTPHVKGLTREQRLAERQLVDGKLVHPRAKHGTPTGYDYFGCKCEPCHERHRTRIKNNRRKKKDEQ